MKNLKKTDIGRMRTTYTQSENSISIINPMLHIQQKKHKSMKTSKKASLQRCLLKLKFN